MSESQELKNPQPQDKNYWPNKWEESMQEQDKLRLQLSQSQAALREMEKELEQLKTQLIVEQKFESTRFLEMRDDRDRLKAELGTANKILNEYCSHWQSCTALTIPTPVNETSCDCGLDKALSAKGGGE